MVTVLVTGASGFIGRRLCHLLRLEGHNVAEASSTSRSGDEPIFDLSDFRSVQRVVQEVRPDAVVHLGALASVTGNNALSYYDINALGTERLLKAVLGLDKRVRFVHISTAGVYGNQEGSILEESMSPLPVHHYGLSKFASERLVFNAASGLDVTVLRPFNVIGPGQRDYFIVPKIIAHFVEQAKIIKLGNTNVIRDYIDLDAACSIIMQTLSEPATIGETINLCSGVGASIGDLLDWMTELTGHRISVEFSEEFARKNEVWKLVGSTEKLDRLLPNRQQSKPLREVLKGILAATAVR